MVVGGGDWGAELAGTLGDVLGDWLGVIVVVGGWGLGRGAGGRPRRRVSQRATSAGGSAASARHHAQWRHRAAGCRTTAAAEGTGGCSAIALLCPFCLETSPRVNCAWFFTQLPSFAALFVPAFEEFRAGNSS